MKLSLPAAFNGGQANRTLQERQCATHLIICSADISAHRSLRSRTWCHNAGTGALLARLHEPVPEMSQVRGCRS